MKRPGFLQATGPNLFLGRRLGIVPPAVSGDSWTPADIADLAVFFWFKPGVGCCFTDVAGTTPAAAGDPVKNATGLFGASVLKATEGTNFPTLRSDGLELDASGVNLLTLSTALPGTGPFTVYWSHLEATGSSIVAMLSDTTAASLLGSAANEIAIYDSTSTQQAVSGTLDSIVVGRFSFNPGDLAFDLLGTGQPPSIGTIGGPPIYPFDQIGGTGAITAGNDSTSNRYRLLIYVNRVIVSGSQEDVRIRSWILTNTGGELPYTTPPTTDVLLLATGDKLLLVDGASFLLLA